MLHHAKKEKYISPVISCISKEDILLYTLKNCALDGKNTNLSLNDIQRRNRIVQLLVDWGLVNISVESKEKISDLAPLNQIKVLSFKEKGELTLESKYNIGRKKED